MVAPHYFIYATMRTGSSLICEWLGRYLMAHHGYANELQEYFSSDCYRYDGEHIDWSDGHASFDDRCEWYAATPHRYLVKHLASPENPEVTNWLFQSRTPIMLYRENLLAQYLSFGVMKATHNVHDRYKKQPRNIHYPHEMFVAFTGHLSSWTTRCREKEPHWVFLSYEEFVARPTILIDKLGLAPTEFHFKSKWAKQLTDAEKCFSNMDEIRDWFNSHHRTFGTV